MGRNIEYSANMSKFEHNQLLIAGEVLCDQSKPLKERFRALFSLKDAAKIDSKNGDLIISLMFKGLDKKDTSKLLQILLDEKLSLFERYRAMFALRNKGDKESIQSIAQGFKCTNALFRHEIAYVLGQIQSDVSTDPLLDRLRDSEENDMVRHECAEALGSIASDSINGELEKYLDVSIPPVLRESCVVALDFAEYNQNEDQFQYADALSRA